MQTLEEEVNKPTHYRTHESGIEAIEVTRYLPGDLSNAWKYGMRYEDKGTPKKDLKKLCWYMNDYLKEFVDSYGNISVSFSVPDFVLDKMEKIIETEPQPAIKKLFIEIHSISINQCVLESDTLNKVLSDIEKLSETFSN